MLYGSTGLRNNLLPMMRELFNRGCAKLNLYSGSVPASADAAVSGTLLCTLTGEGATVKAKQKIRFTPVTAGTTGTWSITLNGVTFTFTDDASPIVAEVCTGLFRLINTAQGTSAKYFTNSTDGAITAGGRINAPDVYQKFTLTDNATSLDIEAATAGVGFDYSSTATGAGNSITETVVQADAYGLKFEAIADIATGIIEKLSTQTWEGTNSATGTATYWRLVLDSDTGVESTTEIRVQGAINVANSDMNRAAGTTLTSGDDSKTTVFSLTLPASKA